MSGHAPRVASLRRRAAVAPKRAIAILAAGAVLGAMLTMLFQTQGHHTGGLPWGSLIADEDAGSRSRSAAGRNRYTLNLRRLNPDHEYPEDIAQWLPMVVEECQPWMPPESAPCVKEAAGLDSNLITAQELLYPDFRVRRPGFLKPEHAQTWDRIQHLSLEYDYRLRTPGWRRSDAQRGQNLVFANATLGFMPPPDSWGPMHCMAAEAPHTQWLKSKAAAARDMAAAQTSGHSAINGTVILATTPQALTWAHFAEAATHPPIQAVEFISGITYAVTGAPGQGANSLDDWQPSLWRGLGFDYNNVLHAADVNGKVAQELVFACRCPNYHPMYDLAVAYAGGANRTVPLSQRKTLMYFSRTPGAGGHANNGGRAVTNEGELLDRVRALLESRGKGERLEVFNHENFPKFSDVVQYFSNEVMAVVGPHGSAMLNMHWVAPGALVLEMMAAGQHNNEIFWLMASALGHNYWALPVGGPNDGKQSDLTVPIDDIIAILDRNLGVPDPLGPGIEPGYWWDFESPGLPRSGLRKGWEPVAAQPQQQVEQ